MPLPMRQMGKVGSSPSCLPVPMRPCTAAQAHAGLGLGRLLPSRTSLIQPAVNGSYSSSSSSSSSIRAAESRREKFASRVKCHSSTPDAAMPPHKDETFLEAVQNAYGRFTGLAGKFMPMVCLFFFLSFVNTILDSLKDTLVITASGGGAQVIPYLTVYAVLPSSVIFLVAYSFASQRLTRGQLFNAIVAVFMSFFAAFAFIMYPNHELLHPHGAADALSQILPNGVEGLVGMIRNWTFTLFFCISELWGDVCLGLLFWGLANDITSLSDAGLMYPLFGLGANLAQALAGSVLKFFSNFSHGMGTGGGASFCQEVQGLMCVVMLFSAAALTLHSVIDRNHRRALLRERQERKAEEKRLKEKLKAEGFSTEQLRLRLEVQAALQGETSSGSEEDDDDAQQAQQRDRQASHSSASAGPSSASQRVPASSSSNSNGMGSNAGSPEAASTAPDEGQQKQQGKKGKQQRKPKASVMEIFGVLAASTPIRCLTIMSLAQGLCTNLMEFAWKSHIGLLFPGPKEFTAFMGDVSMWQGLVTGLLMIATPAMFDKMGWAGVASATPSILLWGGVAFFATCIAYQLGFAGHAAEVAASLASGAAANGSAGASAAAEAAGANSMGGLMLRGLVFGGALLYVFSKSAKFSLFKPAEEMVYISLDEEGRTKGKAAIDVVGTQAGKSGGSVLQQVLLLATGGAIGSILPIMFGFYFTMANGWLKSVQVLSKFANYGHTSSVHESIGVLGSMEEEELRASHPSAHSTPESSMDEEEEGTQGLGLNGRHHSNNGTTDPQDNPSQLQPSQQPR